MDAGSDETIGRIDFGDGIKRPLLSTVEHPSERGLTIVEYVVGRHEGQAQDGRTLSVFSIVYATGEHGAQLYPSMEDALAEIEEDAPDPAD